MNTKIPVNKLADSVALIAEVDSSKALTIIKDLFSLIEEQVTTGGSITIPGLGTFTKSHQSGEPIAFIADGEFADVINEPFALFSPVVLNDAVTTEALDSIEEIVPKMPTEEPFEEAVESVPEMPREELTQIPDSEAVSEQPRQLSGSTEEAVIVEVIEQENPVEKEAQPDEKNPIASTPPPAPTEVIAESLDPISRTAPIEIEQVAKVPISESIPEEETLSSTVLPPEFPEEYRKPRTRFWAGFTIGLLIGFALGIIAFLAYLINYRSIPVESIF